MLRVLLYLIIIPVVLIIAAAFIIPLFLDEDKLLALAAEALEKQTGATLTVNGDAKLSLFPSIAMQLREAELSLPGEGQPDLSARSLDIGVQLMPLFSGSVEIEGFAVDGLLINIPPASKRPGVDTSQMSDTQLDAFYAARRKALAEGGKAHQGAGAALALPMALEVGRLAVTNSRVVLLATGDSAPTVIDIKTLKARHLNLEGKPVPLSLSLSVPGQRGSDPLTLELETTFTLDTEGQQLTLSALNAEISGASAEPIKLTAKGSANLQQMAADLDLQLDIGPAHGTGTLRYVALESPQIDAKLHFNQLSPALFALAGPTNDAKRDDDSEASGDEPLPLATLRSVDTRAELRVDTATVDGHDITDLRTHLRARDGVLKINRLSGKLYGGELAMVATFNAKHNTAKLTTKGSVSDVNIATALIALESNPVATGTASIDWQLSSAGASTNALRDQLHGPIGIHTKALVLKGLGIERMLCETVALAKREKLSAELPRDSVFEALTADIKVQDGKARLAPLRAELQHIALTGTGDLDLKSLQFDVGFKARLDAGLSEVDPACRINERYTAIDWPLECEGELTGDPGDWCAVDSGEILEELAKNEAKRKLGKEAGKLFDKLLKQD